LDVDSGGPKELRNGGSRYLTLAMALLRTGVWRPTEKYVDYAKVSTNIYNAQLSRMSHCAPVARKPICLEFTPEAAVGNILVA